MLHPIWGLGSELCTYVRNHIKLNWPPSLSFQLEEFAFPVQVKGNTYPYVPGSHSAWWGEGPARTELHEKYNMWLFCSSSLETQSSLSRGGSRVASSTLYFFPSVNTIEREYVKKPLPRDSPTSFSQTWHGSAAWVWRISVGSQGLMI